MKNQIYQIHISLIDFKPRIWRRILIHPDILLVDFHRIIQTVMGWTNSHLHQFEKDRAFYAPNELEIEDTADSRKIKVNKLLKKENDRIKYEYDFGDGWRHDIVLEKILPFDSAIQLPVCIKGKRNCPPEDCGGIWGYADLLEIISTPRHKEYKEMIDWLGEDFDPNYFDLDEINEMLQEENYGCLWLD
ncbi:MAG: plasmid pRiA4b ORF-3 family protein [Paludibacter sp.]|nr:plasmid pRiA4b ORF-3 family protein [Paludibacter sp.]